MNILGVDYGRRRVGLAIGLAGLAEPHSVLEVSAPEEAIEKISQLVQTEGVEKIVVGISEGEMAREQEEFAKKMGAAIKIPVETWDETLTTEDAQRLAIEAGVPRQKRQRLLDAFAASYMLQSYLEAYGSQKGSRSV